jgi:hypothetical protein
MVIGIWGESVAEKRAIFKARVGKILNSCNAARAAERGGSVIEAIALVAEHEAEDALAQMLATMKTPPTCPGLPLQAEG